MKTLAETDYPLQRQAGSQNGREKQIKKLIRKYETTIFSFFRELGLPLNCREIIRAYILASDGETAFEASYNELTDILYKRSSARLKANREAVRYNIRALQNWQKKKEVELIRVIEKGRKIKHPDGSEEYQKTKYQFVLLEELVKVLYICPPEEMNARIKEAVARMRDNFVPEDKKAKLPVYYKMQRNWKTIFTKFGKVFEQAEEIKRNPVEECQKMIFELQAALDDMTAWRDEKQRRDEYISAIHDDTNLPETVAYEGRGVETHRLNSTEGMGRILPSVNHPSLSSMQDESVWRKGTNEIDEIVENKKVTPLNLNLGENLSDNPLENAALDYALAGYPVFPLHNPIFAGDSVRCSCLYWKSCDKIGKHPRTRFAVNDSTTDLETIRQWWQRWPDANIGLPTGKESGIFVLDIDPKSGGPYSLEELEETYGKLPGTLKQRTGSNGEHRIFSYPDVRIKNSVSAIGSGLDIRSDGGYIVAAPSIHASGNSYEWHGVNTPVKSAPDWLIAVILIAEKEQARPKEQNSVPIIIPVRGEIIKEGEGRNNFVFRRASGLVNSFSQQEVRRRAEAINMSRCVPPLDEKELSKLLESAERYRPMQIH